MLLSKYAALTNNKTFANVLLGKLQERKENIQILNLTFLQRV